MITCENVFLFQTSRRHIVSKESLEALFGYFVHKDCILQEK